jgi:Asp-tRNA(Asn)/Glu-tRNA(Gln) amidotransferase A subunit family amidase
MKAYRSYIFIGVFFLLGFTVSGLMEGGKVTKEIISQAEKMLGFNFSETQIDTMTDAAEGHLKNYENIRAYNLENSVPPSLIFNPVPEGWQIPSKKINSTFTDYSKTKMPANKNDLAFYSVGQLAALIKSSQISCEELTRFYLNRLKEYDPKLHCVISYTEDYAINKARQLDAELKAGKYRGVLHGIPYGLKDLFSVKGYRTTWGAVPFKDQTIDFNSAVFRKLDDAGGVLLAKLTMGALAMGDVWYGEMTRNPWDTATGSSGSSAGSAASVSAGLLPFAIGTETWGSIVSPSTICGVTGLRPTFGAVSRSGAMALSWSMDKVGPICRNAEDCALIFSIIKGKDNADPVTVDYPTGFNAKTDIKKMRIGYLSNYFSRKHDLSSNDSLTLEKMKALGFNLTPVNFDPGVPLQDLAIILESEAGAAFQKITLNNQVEKMVKQDKNAWPNVFRAAQFIPAVDYINASRIRTILIKNFNDLIKKYDVLVFPSLEDDSQLITNLTGNPCISIPTGTDSKGMPTSISFIGNLYDETSILSAAYQLQKGMNKEMIPPLVKGK